MRGSWVLVLVVALLSAQAVRADAGLPSGGPPKRADYFAFFDNLADFPDYVFFLTPGGVKVVSPSQQVALQERAELVAVPAALVQGTDRLPEELLDDKHPEVLRSPVLLTGRRALLSTDTPRIIRHYRIEIDNSQLQCPVVGEAEFANPPSPALFLAIFGGGLCAVLAVVVGLVLGVSFLIRRALRAGRSPA